MCINKGCNWKELGEKLLKFSTDIIMNYTHHVINLYQWLDYNYDRIQNFHYMNIFINGKW